MERNSLHLTVVSPERSLFEGDVKYVELPGSAGLFSVLYGHAPLISSLGEGLVKFKSEEGTRRIAIRNGFVEVLDNSVAVCVTEA